MLVAAKLHSGRKTDIYDIFAAIPSINLDMVETHLHRGDADVLRDQLGDAQMYIEEGGLDHRFKSMFGQSSASEEDIETLLEFLKRQQEKIALSTIAAAVSVSGHRRSRRVRKGSSSKSTLVEKA